MKKSEENNIRVIISGGGTGGHVFPAISIADTIKENFKNPQILFIGSDNRLETTAVPKAGYDFIGLPIRGLQRKFSLKFFDTFFRLLKSIRMSRKIIRKFKPDIVIGVGGYASAAVMHVAAKKGIPTLIQEQNSFPGITNRVLAKNARAVCVAYENMEKFFPPNKVFLTGNPIRKLNQNAISKQDARKFFNLSPDKKTLLVTGGSLGAKTINKSIMNNFDLILNADIQLIWQTGKTYFNEVQNFYISKNSPKNIIVTKFIDRMDLAYKAADLVISRAGAITISELALLNKPVIFVPSPNVAEDHQTKNAQALVNINAALLVPDNKAIEDLVPLALNIIADNEKLNNLQNNIAKYAKPDANQNIINIIKKIVQKM
jgi:UDP-N-acetylglucosamine--N-acetylmuramyl-(pentapeptide) pyrophosphoryl-undecaprenol N-acetylglucosamine transferase